MTLVHIYRDHFHKGWFVTTKRAESVATIFLKKGWKTSRNNQNGEVTLYEEGEGWGKHITIIPNFTTLDDSKEIIKKVMKW